MLEALSELADLRHRDVTIRLARIFPATLVAECAEDEKPALHVRPDGSLLVRASATAPDALWRFSRKLLERRLAQL